jgi:alkylation response protein AidB-like acyl-CoA dehydrogenase
MMELRAHTPAGADLVALAEGLAGDFASRAAAHDRDGTYPHESIRSLRDAGYLVAPVPAELGGLGVSSVHDLVVASGRLARGDASVAIGVNMHLIAVMALARRMAMAVAAGRSGRAEAFAESLRAIVRERSVIAAAQSEQGQDLTRPATRAERTAGGWRIDGHKVFCTMSPAATTLLTAVSFVDGAGVERYGFVQVPADAPGVTINGDWDALGMRASGSHSITLSGVELPVGAVRGGFPTGETVAYLDRNITSGLFHASASLGIAESAFARVAVAERVRDDARANMLVAEAAIDLAAARGILARAASLVDEHYDAHPTDDGTDDEVVAVFSEGQAAKAFVVEAATRVVDRALALSGGAGYLNGSPLARAYRDVRAGAFMHPLGANRVYGFLARTALGLRPQLT